MTKVLSSSGHSKGTRGDISLILAMLFTAVTIAVVITQQLIASQRIKLLYQISEAIDGYAFNEINTWRLFYRNKAALPLDTGLLKGTITTTTNGVASSISYL